MDSNEKKPVEVVKKELKPIITEAPPKVKKSPMKTFMSELISDDISVIGEYLVHDVLVPTIQNTIVDAVCSSISMIFHQGNPGPYYRNNRGGDYGSWNRQIKNDYGTYYRSGDRTYRPGYDSNMEQSQRRYGRYSDAPMRDYLDYPIRDRFKAQQVLDTLRDRLDMYDTVSIAEFYQLVGYEYRDSWEYNRSTLSDYGWFSLDNVVIVSRGPNVYSLTMPKAVYIK